ncbi:MAG: DUF92 domain-containing protein [Terracidiphilus sp.]
MVEKKLNWQSKTVLLAVLPFAGTEVALNCFWWATKGPAVAVWAVGCSALLAVLTWILRAATPSASLTGLLITASLMFSTGTIPYEPWHTALAPILAVSLLAFGATRAGGRKKEQLGTAEGRRGRSAAQVAANLGVAAMVASSPMEMWLMNAGVAPGMMAHSVATVLSLAAMAEAAADTVSSEIGQVIGGRPRLITTLRTVEPGRDGAVSLAGSAAGVAAAAVVAGVGDWALGGGWELFWISGAGAVFGLFFDSLLGATLEEHGWLNNDAVNFLSTASAAGFALLLLALRPHLGIG